LSREKWILSWKRENKKWYQVPEHGTALLVPCAATSQSFKKPLAFGARRKSGRPSYGLCARRSNSQQGDCWPLTFVNFRWLLNRNLFLIIFRVESVSGVSFWKLNLDSAVMIKCYLLDWLDNDLYVNWVEIGELIIDYDM
jgi:hypothetical protein